MATPIKWGNEFLVNTITTARQDRPAITGLADGRFVAMWTDRSEELGDSSDRAVHGQIFNADGSKAGDEFRVNESTSLAQFLPVVTALKNGGFVAAWTHDNGADLDGRAQVFNPDGSRSGAELPVNALTDGSQFVSDIVALAGDGFVVTWEGESGNDTDIQAQVFSAAGDTIGGEITVNTTTALHQAAPAITALTKDDRFVVAWDSDSPNGHSIRFQIHNADGSPFGGETTASSAVLGQPHDADIAALPEGRFVICWTNNVQGKINIHGQVFNADGTAAGAAFTANATADDNVTPKITAFADGRFAVTWTVNGAGQDIHAQLFDADGTRSGAEFVVNTSIDGVALLPTIAALADGRFVVAWTDSPVMGAGGDGSNAGIRAQIFDPRESGAEINGTALNDDLIGTGFNDKFKGGNGDDHLAGMDGNDVLEGGAGDDTAVFSHSFNEYAVMDFGTKLMVAGPEGIDTLTAIERLKFADTTITPADFDDGNPSFDTLYYLSRNSDVFHAGVNALEHFNAFGRHEGRNPNAFFDTADYLQVYQDAAASGMNPLEHYHQLGWQQGHDPAANFDTRSYLIHNPDVAAAGIDPLQHFLQYGFAEGRQAYAAVGDRIVGGFDAEFYLRHNADVAAAGVDPLTHYNMFGWHEGRDPNGWFDTAGYLAHYADVAAAGVNPLEHYMAFGWQEGRDPSASFDTLGYLAANPDVAAAHVDPLEHFLTFGIYEGRQAVNDGVWH